MHGLARWVWYGESAGARLARRSLAPASRLYALGMRVRARGYRAAVLRTRRLPLPSVTVGGLTVGGAGKTPVARALARYCLERGARPAVLMRGYGGDEGAIHRSAGPVIVVENPDRWAGAHEARRQGADIVILDDGYQRLDVMVDLKILLLDAETERGLPGPLPAGPAREDETALRRADIIVVTRKSASYAEALDVGRRARMVAPDVPQALAALTLAGFRTLHSRALLPAEVVAGRRILLSAGVARPDVLARQLEMEGAHTTVLPWRDHMAYRQRHIARILHDSASVDYVVITEKDANKLERQWPDSHEPLVAQQDVRWDGNGETVMGALHALIS